MMFLVFDLTLSQFTIYVILTLAKYCHAIRYKWKIQANNQVYLEYKVRFIIIGKYSI
jgi:hypothetical protein